MNDKKRIVSMITTSTLILGVTICSFNLVHSEKERANTIESYERLHNNIESMNSEIDKLHDDYNSNTYSIYSRILELQSDNSEDKVRAKVVKSLSSDVGDPIKLEASTLALLENYKDLQDDVKIQTYLNDNVRILNTIEKYENVQNKYLKILDNYEKSLE